MENNSKTEYTDAVFSAKERKARKKTNFKPTVNRTTRVKKTSKNSKTKKELVGAQEEVGFKKENLKIIPLGGIQEIGKNITVFEYENDIVIVDCGVSFPEDDMLGIDLVIPDFTYLVKNKEKIRGLVVTHGHEDHIGCIPFLLRLVNIPVIYATPLACALIKRKLDEHHLTHATSFIQIDDDYQIRTENFNIGFFKTNHSIPESMGIVINTSNGRIVSTGDYKFDLTPVGDPADFQKMSFLGYTGVTLLMADSTNSEIPTFSISEKQVANSILDIFRKTEGRLIVATFASNVHRVQQIIEGAVKFDRRILVYGRSMENVINTSRRMGYIKCPDRYFIKNDEAKNLPDNEILILCTGSQGEALAALSRIANGTHRQVSIKLGDTVVFSSNPIPGNASSVSKVINKLYRAGARVLTNEAINPRVAFSFL